MLSTALSKAKVAEAVADSNEIADDAIAEARGKVRAAAGAITGPPEVTVASFSHLPSLPPTT